MPDPITQTPPRSQTRVGPILFSSAVLIGLATVWYQTAQHFNTPMLVFRSVESAIKLTVLISVLRERRWAYIVQIILSSLAFLSAMALFWQPNRRPLGDPLVWINLIAQVLAGVYCVFRLIVSPTSAESAH